MDFITEDELIVWTLKIFGIIMKKKAWDVSIVTVF